MPPHPCEDGHDIACRTTHMLVDDVHVLTDLLLKIVERESTRTKACQPNRFIYLIHIIQHKLINLVQR